MPFTKSFVILPHPSLFSFTQYVIKHNLRPSSLFHLLNFVKIPYDSHHSNCFNRRSPFFPTWIQPLFSATFDGSSFGEWALLSLGTSSFAWSTQEIAFSSLFLEDSKEDLTFTRLLVFPLTLNLENPHWHALLCDWFLFSLVVFLWQELPICRLLLSFTESVLLCTSFPPFGPPVIFPDFVIPQTLGAIFDYMTCFITSSTSKWNFFIIKLLNPYIA